MAIVQGESGAHLWYPPVPLSIRGGPVRPEVEAAHTAQEAPMTKTQRITPMLWFDGQAEEAAKYYVATFPNSRVLGTPRYDEAGAQASGQPKGSVMTVQFELDGQEFTALNGGGTFKLTEGVAFRGGCGDP